MISWPIRNMHETLVKRKAFIQRLIEAYCNGKEVIYFDETSVNPWLYQRRVWQSVKDPYVHRLPTNDRRSSTVMGAISNKFEHLVFTTCRSTKATHVLRFMKKLKKEVEKPRNTIIVLDNHSAHKGK